MLSLNFDQSATVESCGLLLVFLMINKNNESLQPGNCLVHFSQNGPGQVAYLERPHRDFRPLDSGPSKQAALCSKQETFLRPFGLCFGLEEI